MRDTRRTLIISGGLTLAAGVATAIGAVIIETQGESLLGVVFVFFGLGIAPFAGVWFLSSVVSGARKEALEQGKNEIARWKLSPDDWRGFREQEARWLKAGRAINILGEGDYRDGEVIFARRGVIADGHYHDLTPGGFADLMSAEYLQGSPSCLEFSMRSAKPRGSSGTGIGFIYLTLRVPVAPDDTRGAVKVLAHFTKTTRRSPPLAMINPKLTIRICLGLAAICAMSAIWGFANRSTDAYGDMPVIAAVAGVMIGGGALLLAGIVANRVRMAKR